MGKLVQDGHNSALADRIGYGGAEDVGLGEGHCTGVLHGAGVEVRNPELVILLERVWEVKGLLEVGKSFLSLLEDVLRVHVLRQ